MKTNVSINLNDTERRLLADFIDNKKTKRLATRAEIAALARLSIGRILIAEGTAVFNTDGLSADGLSGIKSVAANASIIAGADRCETNLIETAMMGLSKMAAIADPEDTDHLADKSRTNPADSLGPCLPNQAETPDPEDADHLAGKSAGHVRGWNQVKYEAEVKSRAGRLFGPGD